LRSLGRAETVHGFRSAFSTWGERVYEACGSRCRTIPGASGGRRCRTCLPAQRPIRGAPSPDGGLGQFPEFGI